MRFIPHIQTFMYDKNVIESGMHIWLISMKLYQLCQRLFQRHCTRQGNKKAQNNLPLTAGESYLAILGSLLFRKDDEDRQPTINESIITSVSFYSLECAVTIKKQIMCITKEVKNHRGGETNTGLKTHWVTYQPEWEMALHCYAAI